MDKDQCKAKGGKWDEGNCYLPAKKSSKSYIQEDKKKSSIIWLIISLIVDAIGYLSYLLPGIGEALDIIWAPISGFIVYLLYGNTFAALTAGFEEIMPGLDFIPTATLTWIYYLAKEKL